MKVRGEKADVDAFEHIMKRMIDWGKRHNELSEEKIVQIVKGEVKEDDLKEEDSLILFGVNGKKIMARTKNQKKLKDDFEKYDLMFATGPAGSGGESRSKTGSRRSGRARGGDFPLLRASETTGNGKGGLPAGSRDTGHPDGGHGRHCPGKPAGGPSP